MKVDALVLQRNRALLADVYEKRLKKIARLAKRICDSSGFMISDDIENICEIRRIAEDAMALRERE